MSSAGGSVQTVYCEILTVRILLAFVMPRLWRARRRIRTFYFVDASRVAANLARLFGIVVRVPVERLAFRLVDVRDERGQLIRLRVAYQDIDEVQREAALLPMFRAFLNAASLDDVETEYLAKCVGAISLTDHTTLWRALLLVQIALWRTRKDGGGQAVLLLERRPWQAVLHAYARRQGVVPIDGGRVFRPRQMVRDRLRPGGVAVVRRWRDIAGHFWFLLRHGASVRDAMALRPAAARTEGGPKIAVEDLGQFNLNDPAYYSDLFFWQESEMDGRDILLTFVAPQEALDRAKLTQLQEHGITALALYPGATTVAEVPIFTHTRRWRRRPAAAAPSVGWQRSWEWRWMQEKIENYDVVREYWSALFAAHDVKLYLTWYRVDERIYPIAEALRRLGGVTGIYQRSFQVDPNPEMSVDVELVFGFSPLDAEVERRSGSRIDYHVAVGYTADHRAKYLRPAAEQIRHRLLTNGAERIVAYFDENSADDSRWHTGHEFMRENYVFVLERLLADPTLGLVLKPKRPSSLRRRLGPVAPLLKRALATGRCHLHETGPMHGSEPPVLAALAADLVVHGHLCGSTAGFEAALTGVPTVLLDREGWPGSLMFELGVGSVVFTNWIDLWSAVTDHLGRPGGIPGFGRWDALIDRLDPFRDGRAAERLGNYVDWVIKGLRAGQSRDAVLASAADRYASLWGADKITRVDGRNAVQQ